MRKNSSGTRYIRLKLPYKLTKELFGNEQESPGNHHRSSLSSRKDRRKEERKLKKTKITSNEYNNPRNTVRKHPMQRLPGDIHRHSQPKATALPQHTDMKKRKYPNQTNNNTQDHKMPDSLFLVKKKHKNNTPAITTHTTRQSTKKLNSVGAPQSLKFRPSNIDAELELQKALAKKLGMSKKKKTMGGDDGLDELLQELGGVDDILYSEDDTNVEVDHTSMDLDDDDDDADDADDADDDAAADDDDIEDDGKEQYKNHELHMEDEEENVLLHSSNIEQLHDKPATVPSSQRYIPPSSQKYIPPSSQKYIPPSSQRYIPPSSQRYIPPSSQRYIPPALLRQQQALQHTATEHAITADEQRTARRIRGLLNRLTESNLPGIVAQVADMYVNEGRSIVSHAVCNELVSAAVEGPKGSEQFAAVAAACVAGIAGIAGSSEPLATLTAQIASSIQEAIDKEDSMAYGNLVHVLGQLFLCHAIKADIIFDALEYWSARFTESDIMCIVMLLRVAGLQLRGSDPEKMKGFVVSIHHTAGEHQAKNVVDKAAEKKTKQQKNLHDKDDTRKEGLSTRARVMLDLVVDIKNNRKRDSGNSFKVGSLSPGVSKWLKSLKIDGLALGGISWQKIVSGSKKGIWWMPTASDGLAALAASRDSNKTKSSVSGGMTLGHARGHGLVTESTAAPEALLQLAASMRMNTDVRRAVFCAVMGSEDAADACEKLLRLGLKGDLEREITRVTVECALHESSWNPYYGVLLTRLCGIGKSHKITLQFCFWDHLKRVPEMEIRRFTVLAKLMAHCIAHSAVPLSLIKAADFNDASMGARELLFWRVFFENLFVGCRKDQDIVAMCSKIALSEQLKDLRSALRSFLKRSVGPWLAAKDPDDPVHGGTERLGLLLKRCRIAEKSLASS